MQRNFSAIGFYLFCLGSWWGKGLPSRQSIAKLDRADGHIGSEMPQVDFYAMYIFTFFFLVKIVKIIIFNFCLSKHATSSQEY